MSIWSYVNGTITVEPMGRTQAEKRYILDTVLEHLPIVSGSERNMNVYVIQKKGHDSSSSCDEFGESTNNLTDSYGNKNNPKSGWLNVQQRYILAVDGALRDREFSETYKSFVKWLTRLAKRVNVLSVLVNIQSYGRDEIIKYTGYDNPITEMMEDPSWCKTNPDKEPNWCEYLMWDRMKNCSYPLLLGYKYFNDEENDKEAERRLKYI